MRASAPVSTKTPAPMQAPIPQQGSHVASTCCLSQKRGITAACTTEEMPQNMCQPYGSAGECEKRNCTRPCGPCAPPNRVAQQRELCGVQPSLQLTILSIRSQET